MNGNGVMKLCAPPLFSGCRQKLSLIDLATPVENLSSQKKKDGYIIKLNRVLVRALNDKNLKTIVGRMEEKTQIFDELRDAMHIAASDGKKGLNDDGENVDIKTIEKAVTIFRNSDKIKAAV